MSALDILEDGFPHGTMDGYRLGCKTAHCPAPISCSQVRTRYASDWEFRKRVDAGWTLEQLAQADAAEAAAARPVKRAVARPVRAPRKAKAAKPKPAPKPPREKRISHGTYAGYAAGCRTDCPSTPTCHAQARAYWRSSAEDARRRDGVTAGRKFTAADVAKVHELSAEGLTSREVADQLGMSSSYVRRLVRAAA